MKHLKLSTNLSYLVAILRFSLSFPMSRSTTFRLRYSSLSKPSSDGGYSPFLCLRCAITGLLCRFLISSRIASLSYALSPVTTSNRFRGRPGLPAILTPSNSACTMVDSCCCPQVTSTWIGFPCPSQSTWILLDRPPRLCPKPCRLRLSSGLAPFFFRARRTLVRPNYTAVQRSEFEINSVHLPRSGLQCIQQALPRPVLLPATETVIHRRPRTVALGQVPPRSTRAQHPKNTIQNAAMRLVRTTGLSRTFRWKQRLKQLELFIRKIITCHWNILWNWSLNLGTTLTGIIGSMKNNPKWVKRELSYTA